MEITNFNCLSVGVGGQGVIRATSILAHAAMLDNLTVRTAETHGMAQRGGSVSGYLRFGSSVEGPLIPIGGADIIMSFELIEILRNIRYANKDTYILVNTTKIQPLSIYQNRNLKYPSLEEIRKNLENVTKHVLFINASKLAKEAGTVKAANVVMMGVIAGSGKLPLSIDHLKEAIMKFVPPKAREINEKAFELGMKKGAELKEDK
ncbi:MAG: indolepyruvate oxidoreductase subunit beta [Promethearchaeota archaeon]